MSKPTLTPRQQRIKVCATVILIIGLFQLCIMAFVEIARPPLLTDALHFELADLDCREEAIQRIIAYENKHVTIRMIFPAGIGIVLLVVSGVLFHSLSITSEESDVS